MSKATYLDPAHYLPAAAVARPSVLDTLIGWLAARDAKASDGEVERFVLARGGQMTDDLEREISRRFGGMAGIPRY